MTKSKQFPKRGASLGDWTLKREIASGGNGTVWTAKNKNGETAALKVLRRVDSVSYERFKSEVNIVSQNCDIDGIVPIIDYYLPKIRDKNHAWYTMPLAERIDDHLNIQHPSDVVLHFVEVGKTLEKLHNRGISHRDIKPQNILFLNGRFCLSDFGLVKYPNPLRLTPLRRDVGPKFTMAPEMRRVASAADGKPADVFSFAKTLWICLTGEALGFDGQYHASGELALQKHHPGTYTTSLDQLLSECTDNNPANRPTIGDVVLRLTEWLKLVEDFDQRNSAEWTELLQRLFPIAAPVRAEWSDVDSICVILNEIGRTRALNHMFFPDGGGNTITAAYRAGEPGFIMIEALGNYVVKPKKLSFESTSQNSQWNYFRLEAENVKPTGISAVPPDAMTEYLAEFRPGQYASIDEWNNDSDGNEAAFPPSTKPITRYLSGSFVIFSTSSPYNRDSSTYDARHNKMNEQGFVRYIANNANQTRAR